MIQINVEGQDEVRRLIEKAAKLYPEEAKKGVTLACIKVEKSAKQNAPVDTGRLKASITHKVDGLMGVVGSDVEYAPYIELGTQRMKAQPYLRPALYDNKSNIIKIFTDVLKGVKL